MPILNKKRNMRLIIILAFSAILLASCNENIIIKEYKKTTDYMWHKKDVKEFTFEIPEDSTACNATIMVRYISNCPYKTIAIKVASVTMQEEFNTLCFIQIRDGQGNPLGDGSGDLWDIEYNLFQNKKLPAGTHTVSLEPTAMLQLIDDVGLKIEKVPVAE